MQRYLWKIGGEAGFGIMVSGLMMSKIASRSGYHVFDYSEYPSLIRGGHNTYEVTVSIEEISSSKWEIDLLVCLNKDTYDQHKHRLKPTSIVMYDPEDFDFDELFMKIKIPLRKWRREFEIMQMMTNTIALGASIALLDADFTIFEEILQKEFEKKGAEVIAFNTKLAKTGYDYVKMHYSHHISAVLISKPEKSKLVMTGNDAFSLGSVIADCRLFSAYPMTPTSNVLSTLAGWQTKSNMVVRHAEDEISVINTAIGAAFAGVRSAVATSGGGFALMVESVSFAAMIEIPAVIFLGQRPGPATGMPTWTEQGDLLFAVHAGHGEFPKIVLAPGDMFEMFELTAKAFDMADIYQTPVIILGDKFICESHKSHFKEAFVNFIANYQKDRGKTIVKSYDKQYLRYKLSSDGISDRLIPGQEYMFYQANSDEHYEDGHTSEESLTRIQQSDKRMQKRSTYLAKHFRMPVVIGRLSHSDIVFVTWGGMKGPVLDAQRLLTAKGEQTALIHFNHMYPLDKAKVQALFSEKKRYVLIENNSQGQFGKLLQMETGIDIQEKILKNDGRPFYPEEIVNYVLK